MKLTELKSYLITSLDSDLEPGELIRVMEDADISYKFNEGFTEKVLDRIYSVKSVTTADSVYFKSMNLVFYRVVLTGIAAIVLMMVSILFGQGSISVDSFLGLGDAYDESIICLITGN